MFLKRIGTFSRFIAVVAFLLPLFLCELGQQPVGTDIKEVPQQQQDTLFYSTALDSMTENMRIFVDPTSLRASNTDQAEVKVVVYDDNHNPITGKEILFRATHGIILESGTTDSNGVATTTYHSVPVNAEARIVASMQSGDSLLAVATYIKLTGASVVVASGYSNALINTEIPVTITVLDGAGMPVANKDIAITGAKAGTGVTGGDGTFKTSVTKTTEGTAVIVARSLGAVDSVTLKFWETIPEVGVDTVRSIRGLRVFSSRSQLKANNSDYAIITAILSNERNNPLTGDTVLFSSNLGVIDGYGVVDKTGRTSVRLNSAPINGVCSVTAEVAGEGDAGLRDSVSITFSGISISLTPELTNLSVKDTTIVNVLLTNGSGNPVGGDRVVFQITSSLGVFFGNSKTYITKLDPEGKAVVRVTSAVAGTLSVQASALNTNGITQIYFATNYLTLDTSKSTVAVGGNDSCRITATYTDDSGSPVSGVVIAFAANAGTIFPDSVVTDSSGEASTWLKSSLFSGTATVQAIALDRTAGSAFITASFTAGNAANIELSVTPDNIGVNGGKATLIATVTDSNGNMVSGSDIKFKILKGPGGGEYIHKPVAVTYNGKARSTLSAGSQPSKYRGCEVVAFIGGIADSSKLTISGEPYIVTVSRPEDDTVTVSNAGQMDETTFDFFIGAVVQDINGNPVADGTKVQFSAVVSGMAVGMRYLVKWEETDKGEIKPIYGYRYMDVPFEDINNNKKMDDNVDLKLDNNDAVASRGDDRNGDGVVDYNPAIHDFYFDFNGNGICDPDVSEPFRAESKIWNIVESGRDTVITYLGIDTILVGTVPTPYNRYDTSYVTLYDTLSYTYKYYADLNMNGVWDSTELQTDLNGDGVCDLPASKDFQYWRWEMRPYWLFERFDFNNNDFAVVIDASVTTNGGVAKTRLTYPRQMARRLFVSVNAEANGVRDKDGERFILPIVK